ncbi:putative EGF-like domain-containing protein [Megavirus lba]|uniref:Putative EGF-like domain-containing protein n=1 Tax=Megavirus lba TaxID=1235314 RepID=L7Y718_9VIRU|nr:putative EGF-like domain-containing protein [Megavirus lba]
MIKTLILTVFAFYLLSLTCGNEQMNMDYNSDIISSAIVLHNGTIINVNINVTNLENNYNNILCPNIDIEDLKIERLKVLEKWIERTNYNKSYILQVYDELATPDILVNGSINSYLHQFIVAGFASYSAKTVAAEYSLQAVDPESIQLFSKLDHASIVWQADNISVIYKIITNYSLASFPGKPIFSGFVNYQYTRFEPCTNKIWIDYSRQDSLIGTYLASAQQVKTPNQICDLIMANCIGDNQVYPDYASCINYMSGVANHTTFCPGGLIANSTGCHYFHAQSTIELPTVHCQHVRPYDSPVCQDFCLDQGCGDCDPNAECIFDSVFGKLIPKYQCQCKSGYTGNGKTCVRNNCTADWQCPASYNFGRCNDGICGCKSEAGFIWNPSVEALELSDTCQCSENETVYWHNGTAECIPIGRCREAWQCPQSADLSTSITCSPYGTNILVPFNVCLCNYGYDNPGFSYHCECNANRREIWSNIKQGTLCLFENECTDDFHCVSDKCIIPNGQWLGTCQQDYSSAAGYMSHHFLIRI